MNNSNTPYVDADGCTVIFISRFMRAHMGDIILDLARSYRSVKITEIDTGWLVALDGTTLEASGDGMSAANFNIDAKTAVEIQAQADELMRKSMRKGIDRDGFEF